MIKQNKLLSLIKEMVLLEYSLNKIPTISEAKVTSFNDPKEVISFYANALKRRGFVPIEELGSGFNGVAYLLSNNRVLKVTLDDYEARTANHLKGKKLNHVIRVHDVFKFRTTEGDNWYGIVEDKAEKKIEGQEKLNFDMYVSVLLRNMYIGKTIDNPWSIPWKEIKAATLTNSKEDKEEYSTVVDALKYFESVQLDKLLKELKDNKVIYKDVHCDNFMYIGNKLVLVDLGGHSESPGKMPKEL